MWFTVTKTSAQQPCSFYSKTEEMTVCFDYFRISKINQILLISGYKLLRAEMFPTIHFWDGRRRQCDLQMKTPSLLTRPNSARLLPCYFIMV